MDRHHVEHGAAFLERRSAEVERILLAAPFEVSLERSAIPVLEG
jgi:hypothetical protein